MEYFNLLDTPVWNYHATFFKSSGTGDIQVDIGGNRSRWLIAHMYIEGAFILSNLSFDFDAHLVDYGIDGVTEKIPYHILADDEQFSTTQSKNYLQYPMTPNVPVSGKHVGAHPTTSNLVLVPNGDTLRLIGSNMPFGSFFVVVIKAYTRHKIPDITVTTTGGSSTYYEYTSYLR